MSNPEIERHVRHLVGIATLRRLRRMVDAENAQETDSALWAKRLMILLAAGAVIFIGGFALLLVQTH